MTNKMRIFISLVIMVFLFVGIVQSQTETSKAIHREGRGYSIFGQNFLDIKSLNSRLESKGYSKFSDNFFTVGGGGFAIINRFVIGGEGYTLLGEDNDNSNYKTSISAGCGFFNVGYIIYSTAGLNIFPLLGIGGGGIDLKITEQGSFSFDEILDNPKKSVDITSGAFLLKISLNADYLFPLGKDEKGEGGLAFGLQIGYTFSPIKGDWMRNETEVSGGPDLTLTGPYIHVMFGGGGKSRE